MKITLFFAFLYSLVIGPVYAEVSNSTELLQKVKSLTLRCAVQPYKLSSNGNKVFSSPKSHCSEIQVDGNKATLLVEGETFYAEIVESDDTDGGDLNHLTLFNSKNEVVAQRFNVLGFDNVLIALAGGKEEFIQILED